MLDVDRSVTFPTVTTKTCSDTGESVAGETDLGARSSREWGMKLVAVAAAQPNAVISPDAVTVAAANIESIGSARGAASYL